MAVNKTQNSKGMGLIELLIVIAIITTGLVYLLGMFSFSLRISGEEKKVSQANFMAQELVEGVRNFRDGTSWQDNGLGTLAVFTPYHLERNGSPQKWSLAAGERTTDGFTQQIVFNDVWRDSNDDIIAGGGTLDENSKKVTATVSWQERGKSRQVEIITLFTNWQE